MSGAGTPAEAVEAAARAAYEFRFSGYKSWDDLTPLAKCDAEAEMRYALLAAAPHLMAGIEWAIFRATDDETATPTENRRYRTREIAERHLRYDYAQPEFWEVRGRSVGAWAK